MCHPWTSPCPQPAEIQQCLLDRPLISEFLSILVRTNPSLQKDHPQLFGMPRIIYDQRHRHRKFVIHYPITIRTDGNRPTFSFQEY